MRKCFFFDRDGIVNEPPDPERYVRTVDAFHYIEAFGHAVEVAARHGYDAVLVTNQRGIELGVVDAEEVERMHALVKEKLEGRGHALLDVLVSPYDDDGHPWRKPNPGMLLEAAERHGIDLSRSWMVGDQEKDVVAGQRAGCRTIRVMRTNEETGADHRVDGMDALPGFLEQLLDAEAGADA